LKRVLLMIYGVLPDVEIPLGGQNRFMPDRELNLFERRLAAMRGLSKYAAVRSHAA